jgi:hypothetical protein
VHQRRPGVLLFVMDASRDAEQISPRRQAQLASARGCASS